MVVSVRPAHQIQSFQTGAARRRRHWFPVHAQLQALASIEAGRPVVFGRSLCVVRGARGVGVTGRRHHTRIGWQNAAALRVLSPLLTPHLHINLRGGA